MFSIFDVVKETFVVYITYWWVFTPLILLPIFEALWMSFVQSRFINNMSWTLLEVNVLKEIERGPRTAEEFFTAIHAVAGTAIDTVFDIYLSGVIESYYSMEIVSLEGDVHFYIRVQTKLRDLVESQIYAQYPDAEIVQMTEDYATKIPSDIPNEYDMWGCEWVLEREDAYPIKTYMDYEDTMTSAKAPTKFIDPMANFLEAFGKMGRGEQMWLQILVRPTKDDWKKDAMKLIAKLIGKKKPKEAETLAGFFRDEALDFARYLKEAPFKVPEPAAKKEEADRGEPNQLLYMTPGEQEVLKAIERNISKMGFETKLRWMYIGKKEYFSKPKGVMTGFGAFAQFRSQTLNYFHVDRNTKTSAYYFLTEQRKTLRKRALLSKYKKRLFREKGFILNAEELATLYHYPTISVKAPMKPTARPLAAAPPPELPISGT